MATLKERLKSRKFIGSVVLFITATVLLTLEIISPSIWSTVVLTVYGTYAASNVASKQVQKK